MFSAVGFTSYQVYLEILSRDVPGVLWKVGLVVILMAYFVASGLYLPAWLKTRRGYQEEDEPTGFSLPSFLSLSLVGGISNCLCCWIVSYHLTKSVWPGVIAALPLTAWGLFKVIRKCPCDLSRANDMTFVVVTLIALGLGVWHHGPVANELPPADASIKGAQVAIPFNDRYGDVSFHVLTASLIQEYGLPRIDVFGSNENEYMQLGHVGYATMIAACSTLTQQDAHVVNASLWILCYLTMCWLAISCVEQYNLTTDVQVAASLVPLLWGRLAIPNIRLLVSPSGSVNFEGAGSFVAGAQYHNFSQAWSVVFGLGFLYCYQQYQNSNRSIRWLIAGVMSLVVSGWVKPSLVILLWPALIICMIINRDSLRAWLATIGVTAAGLLVYFLSAFMADLPPRNPMIITLTSEHLFSYIIEEQWLPTIFVFVTSFGAGLIFIYFRARNVVPELKRGNKLNWADLSLLAVLGGLTFALLFREVSSDIRIDVDQPNTRWGLMSSLQLFSCVVVCWLAKDALWRDKFRVPSSLRICAIILICVQFVNGFIYAAVYPLISTRLAFKERKEVLLAAGEQTDQDARFFVEPELLEEFTGLRGELFTSFDLAVYLDRPVALYMSILSGEEQKIYDAWNLFTRLGTEEELEQLIGYVQQRNAIVISSESITAHSVLEKHGWSKKADLTEDYQLWLQGEDAEIPDMAELLEETRRRGEEQVEEEGEHSHEGHDHGTPGSESSLRQFNAPGHP